MTRIRRFLPGFFALAAVALALFFVPDAAMAQDFGLGNLTAEGFGLRGGSATDFVGGMISIVVGILGVVLVGLLVYGGILYMTSAGNEKRVESGKQVITWAIIGLVVVMSAFIISRFVIGAITDNPNAATGGTAAGGSGLSTNPNNADWCTPGDDILLRGKGFYCDYGIGGADDRGTIQRSSGGAIFTTEERRYFESSLPSRADDALFSDSPNCQLNTSICKEGESCVFVETLTNGFSDTKWECRAD